jgi:hypothetical protein
MMKNTTRRIMNNTRLGISIALMTAALIVGGILAQSSANAVLVITKYGGNGGNGGSHDTNTTRGINLNGANGRDSIESITNR